MACQLPFCWRFPDIALLNRLDRELAKAWRLTSKSLLCVESSVSQSPQTLLAITALTKSSGGARRTSQASGNAINTAQHWIFDEHLGPETNACHTLPVRGMGRGSSLIKMLHLSLSSLHAVSKSHMTSGWLCQGGSVTHHPMGQPSSFGTHEQRHE